MDSCPSHFHESGFFVEFERGAGSRLDTYHTQVKNFLKDCGNEFLQELLIPSRLDKAMKALDTDGSGVIEIEEWYGMRRPFS